MTDQDLPQIERGARGRLYYDKATRTIKGAQREPKSFARALYRARIIKVMGLRETAREVQISAPYMSDMEHGRRLPSYGLCKRLALLLDTPDLVDIASQAVVARSLSQWKSDRQAKARITLQQSQRSPTGA